jgi:hypothetical protein
MDQYIRIHRHGLQCRIAKLVAFVGKIAKAATHGQIAVDSSSLDESSGVVDASRLPIVIGFVIEAQG